MTTTTNVNMTPTTNVNMITAEIIRNGMATAAMEMSRTLKRTAVNPLIFESQDFGVGIVSSQGELWGEAPGVAVFVGCLGDTVKHGVAKLGIESFAEGDVILVNDPFETGTHIADTSLYMPIFHSGKLIAFSVVTVHWADIGGMYPGGWCPDSTSVFQEGIRFTHLKLIDKGRRNEALWELIQANVRVPEIVSGDLDAKMAAARQGMERVQTLCDRYGADVVTQSMSHVIERTDEAMRRHIEKIPDGIYRESIKLDSDGVDLDKQVEISVELRVEGDRIIASFGGSPQTTGPVNLPTLGTMSSVRIALKGLTMATDATNEGHFRALDFNITPGLVVTPEHPAPTDSYGLACVAVVELSIRALGQAVPDWCPAGGSQLAGFAMARTDPRLGKPFAYVDPVDGGTGGRPNEDGLCLNVMGNGDVPNTPIEVLESRYPVRVERYEYRPEVAGAGRRRGGPGMRRAYRALEPGIMLNAVLENTKNIMARGLHGGHDADPAQLVVFPGTDRQMQASRTNPAPVLSTGDTFVALTSGGGGLGDPLERDPADVLRDVQDEFLTVEGAEQIYAVRVIQDGHSWAVDETATHALRAN